MAFVSLFHCFGRGSQTVNPATSAFRGLALQACITCQSLNGVLIILVPQCMQEMNVHPFQTEVEGRL